MNSGACWGSFVAVCLAFQTQAQPRIVSQPKNLAVFPGNTATFRLSVTGIPPLEYQWYFDGKPVSGATTNSLTISNAAVSDLGGYQATIRNASGEITSQLAWLQLARFPKMIVFGNSQCMPVTDGPSWVDYVQADLGFPAERVANYAVSGASILGVRSQVETYLMQAGPKTNTLLAPFWAFSNEDLTNTMAISRYVSNYMANISLLANAGGRTFLITTAPPFYWSITNAEAYALDENLCTNFDRAVGEFQKHFNATIFRFDLHDLLLRIKANPGSYGLTNLVDPANSCSRCDRRRYLFWDDSHLTTAAHRLVANEIVACIRPPLVLSVTTGGAEVTLSCRWVGGLPPFKLQRSQDLLQGNWESDPLSFEQQVNLPISGGNQYFRLLQLGQ